MKIVIIGPAHPLRGGLAAFDERLARALLAEGHEVTLFSFSLQYPKLLFPGKTQYTSAPAPKGLNIITRINSINPFNWTRVGKEIVKLEPDLVIVAYWMPFMSPALSRISRIIRRSPAKVIGLVHNLIPHEKRAGDRALSARFLDSIDAAIVLSDSVKKDIHGLRPHLPVVSTPHPLYDHYGSIQDKAAAKKELGLDPAARYVLFFGFVRDYKGLDLLLEAMGDQRVKALGLNLIIAGEYYSGRERYDALIEKNGLQQSVINRNEFIPEEQVAAHFCAADVVVQPYRTATQSGVTQIAYHFERPMIVTNTGGLGEIVPDGRAGYVVEPSSSAIADALLRFYGENREAEFSTNAKEEKKRFGWNVLTGRIMELYKSIPVEL